MERVEGTGTETAIPPMAKEPKTPDSPAKGAADESPFKGKTGVRRMVNAIGYSVSGFGSAFRHEEAFRQETLLGVVLAAIAVWLHVSNMAKALLIFCVLLVLVVELLNSAVEATVDRISLENHRLAKRAKDIGSAAVFLSLVNLVVVWTLVLTG